MQYRKIFLWPGINGIITVLSDQKWHSSSNKKVQAIEKMTPPTKKRQVRAFIGLVKFYRDRKHSMISNTLSRRDTLLTYPDFNELFDIHTDASEKQLGSVIGQTGKPISF